MGDPGYSEWTPGTSASIKCLCGYWKMKYYGGVTEYRDNIYKAITCTDWSDYKDEQPTRPKR